MLISKLIFIATSFVNNWGLLGVFVLMLWEKLIFILPSEAIIPPAAIASYDGAYSFLGVVLMATTGSYLGSSLNYLMGRIAQNFFTKKIEIFIALSSVQSKNWKEWYLEYGWFAILLSPLLPLFGGLLNFFSGAFGFPFHFFSRWNLIGSFAWSFIIAWYGRLYLIESPDALKSPAGMVSAIKMQFQWFVFCELLFLGLFYFYVYRRNKLILDAK